MKEKMKKIFSLEFYEDILVRIFRFFMHRNPLFIYFWLKYYLFDGAFRKDEENRRLFYGKYQSFNQRHPYLSAGTSFVLILAFVFSSVWWLVLRSPESAAAWWNDTWGYRKEIPITYTGSQNLTEYQILIDGLDTATLISAGKLQSDCDDLRFTDRDGNLLDYSIVGNTCNTSDTEIWVKTNRIPASNTLIYMYYGNPNVDSYQNERKTFSYSEEKTVGYILDESVNDLQIISLEDGNSITHNGITRSLNKFETDSFTSISQWGSISAKKLFNADDQNNDTDLFVPISWAGTEFMFYSRTTGTHKIYAIAPWENATVNIYNGGSLTCANQPVTSTGSRIDCSITLGQVRISSDKPILVFSEDGGSMDQMPLRPSSMGKWFGSGSTTWVLSGSGEADYRYMRSSDTVEQDPANLGADTNVGPGIGSSYGSSNGGYVYSTDNPISVHQYADGDGSDSYFYRLQNEMGTVYGSANQADYISVVSDQAATCIVYDSDGSQLAQSTLSSSNSSVYFTGTFGTGNSNTYTSGKWRMECDRPVAAYYQKITDSESNLMSYPLMRQFTYPTPGVGSLGSEEKSKGPVGYWSFDEGYGTTANDGTSNNNDGTISGATWKPESECVSGKCLWFDGTDDRIDTSTKLDIITDEITVGAWVYPINPPDGVGRIIATTYDWDSTPSLERGWTLGNNYGSTDAISIVVYNSNGTGSSTGVSNFFADYKNKWVHVVGEFKGGEYVRMYVNGKLVSENTSNIISAIAPSTLNFRIGTRADTTSQAMWSGYIDEVKIYPYARTEEEIKQDYNAGLAGMGTAKGAGATLGGGSDKWMTDGLVGYWKMDEASWSGTTGEVIDASGNGNNGIAAGGATTAAGKFGNGGNFNGSNYVSVTDGGTSSLDLTGAWSLNAWTYVNSSELNYGHIVGKRGTDSNYNFRTGSAGSNWDCYFWRDGGWHGAWAQGTVHKDAWHYMSCVYDGENTIKIYEDGVEIGSASVGSPPPADNNNLVIGAFGSGSEALDGKIDDVRIYNRALSPQEVRDLYNWAPGPVGHWKMDEGEGTTVYDLSGNNFSGSFIDSPLWKEGKYGKSLYFDGSNDRVSISHNNLLEPKSITVGFWAKLQSDGTRHVLVTKWSGFTTEVNSDGTFRWGLNGLSDQYFGTEKINWDEWVYLAGTYDNETKEQCNYINGIKTECQTPTGSISYSQSTLQFSWNAETHGQIDDVKVYNYARTPKQIVEDMNAGHPIGGSPVGSQKHYWKLDEMQGDTAYNSIEGGQNGTLDGIASPSWTSEGKFGGAIDCEADYDQHVDLGNIVENESALTVSAWIKPESLNGWIIGEGASFRIKAESDGDVTFWLRGNNSSDVDTSDQTSTTNTPLLAGNWYHVLGIWDGASGDRKIYVDGKLAIDGSTNVVEFNGDSNNATICHAYNDAADPTFDGLIDEVKIYNSALTEEEIWRDYNQGKAMVLGSSGTDSSGNPSFSADRSYCVPGDTSTCNPPVAEWKFDEMAGTTAYDTSENQNNGTLNGNPIWTGLGKVGSAVNFDGSDDFITMGDDSNLNVGTEDFTLNLWVWIDSNQNNSYPQLIFKGGWGGTTQPGYNLYYNNANGSLSFRTKYADLGSEYTSNYDLSADNLLDQWIHISCSVDRSNYQRLYINGLVRDQDDISSQSAISLTNTQSFFVGGTGYPFKGKIDDVKIYDYARTPAQVAWDYNRGKPVGWWRMDEGEGTTVYDHSGNGNNGTMTNMDPATDWVDGKINTALDFDDGSDYVNIPNPDELSDEHVTVSSWVKVDVMENWHNFVANSWGADDPAGWLLYASANGPVFGLWNSTGQKNASVTMDLTDGWHHVVGVYDGSQVKTYVDGVLRSSLNASSITLETSANLTIGGSTDGFVDDVRIYNYALTPLQIKEIYNGGAVNYR